MVEVNTDIFSRHQLAKNPGLTEEQIAACEELEEKLRTIKKGGTTGDPIDDFELSNYLQPYLKGEHPFRDLMKGVEAGGLMLVVENTAENMVHSGPGGGPPAQYEIRTRLLLGVLEEAPQFVATKSEVVFPMQQYVEQSRRSDGWEIQEGHIQLDMMQLLNLGKMAQPTFGNAVPCLRAYGGEEVFDYFMLTNTRAAQVAGKPVPDLDLVPGLRLLSQPLPDDFQQSYDAKMYRGQVHVVRKLQAALLKKEDIVTSREYLGRGRDELDMQQRQELRPVRREIVDALQKGERFEMRTTLNIYDEVPGQTIRIGEFATALWEKYVEPTEKK